MVDTVVDIPRYSMAISGTTSLDNSRHARKARTRKPVYGHNRPRYGLLTMIDATEEATEMEAGSSSRVYATEIRLGSSLYGLLLEFPAVAIKLDGTGFTSWGLEATDNFAAVSDQFPRRLFLSTFHLQKTM